MTKQPNIEAELVRMLYQQAYTAIMTVIVTAIGVAVIYYGAFPHEVVFTWFALVILLSFFRYWSVRRYHARDPLAGDDSRWGWLFAFFTFLSGLIWGSASILFFTPDNLLLFNILTLIIIVISVGSMLALSAFPAAFYLFVFTAMLPMIWRYLNIDEQSYEIFGFLLILYNIGLFKLARVNNKVIRDSIALRFENIDLIGQLTEQKEKAEQANISKTKFLASASHDMRQPIHAMGLFLGVLEDRIDKEEHRVIVKKIQKSSDALGGLLNSLLDISKLDAGVIKVVRETFPLDTLFKALNNEFQALAKEKNLQIKFSRTSLWVNSDYRILERIMRNLISNAIRYTDNGRILVGCRRYHERALVAVYDTGIGIPEGNLQDIFDEFHQLQNPERDRSRGLGLGLAIVERMTKLLDIPLHVKSSEGNGSVFGFVLPTLQSSTLLPENTAATAEIPGFGGKQVLVIDDEAAIRESLTELLRNWHCDVIAAASGDEAIRTLQKNEKQPDVMLVDYRLRNNETGTMVIDKINSLFTMPATREKIPAIIITGDTAPDRIREAESSGYKIMHKPVSPEALKLLLTKALAEP